MLGAIASMHVSESLCRALFYLLVRDPVFLSLCKSVFPPTFAWLTGDGEMATLPRADLATKTGRGCGSPDLRVVG